jgi:divalent metal cation (Fe/Co/Zn/Cd) transporter
VFVAAAAFSLREGIDELIHPSATSSFAVAYVVLAISTVLDLVSFRQSAGQMIRRARRYHREFLEESRVTSDPSLRAVFVEDAVSVSGDVIALAAVALNQITGSSIPQGVAAVLIALVLIRVSLRLMQRSPFIRAAPQPPERLAFAGIRCLAVNLHRDADLAVPQDLHCDPGLHIERGAPTMVL